MPASTSEQVIRECAFEIIRISDAHAADGRALAQALRAPLQRIVALPDLLSLGVPRQGNHIDHSKYLYYDGQLVISLDEFPKGKHIPPHDHGVWEAIAMYRGSVDHTVYQRLDDGSREGHAELVRVEDRRLGPGDVSVLIAPAEIHSFIALEEGTHSLTVVGGHYAELRHYFKPDENTCIVRRPRPAVSAGRAIN
jgi:predicted metal-dependent enzyme (double-stranded beta helix superfamily)